VTLSAPINATISDGQASGTITNDDAFFATPAPATHGELRAIHFAELRSQIDLLRSLHGLGAFSWTGDPPAPGMTPILEHITEARTALGQVYTHAGVGAPSYSVDPTLTRGMPIKKDHVLQLREAIRVAP
jgi:hypothetical protein